MNEQTGQDARFGAWVQSLGPGGGDSLLHFVPTPRNSVELTHAHPSGLAQLLSGRRTRLSTLLRDPVQYTAARRTARAISATVSDVAQQRGIEVGYLATGLLTWRTLRTGGNDFHSAPVMLGHVSCARREGVDDEEFQLVERCRPNQALLRHLVHTFGVKVSEEELLEAAYMTARFDPAGPIAVLREALSDVPGLVVADRMVVSTFADVADPADPEIVSGEHPIIAALMDSVGDDTIRPGRRSRAGRAAGTDEAAATGPEVAESAAAEPEAPDGDVRSEGSDPAVGQESETAVPAEAQAATIDTGIPVTLRDDVMTVPSDLRDPADEVMVLDADEAQYDILEMVSAGRSVTVSAPAGTGSTTLAVNAAARLAAVGKRVLVVAEREQSVQDFIGSMARVGLDSLVVNMRRDTSADSLRAGLVRAVLRNERAKQPETSTNDAVLRDRRVSLVEHVRSLRSVRPRWEASPLQAMRELARVTAQVPAPATRVRLKRSVLDAMPRRAPVVEQLERASDLGAFDAATKRSPWYGSRLSHRGEAEAAVTLVTGLATDLPPLRQRLEAIAKATRIKPVKTFSQWGKTLRLLVDVRRSLDQFEPDVFDKEVDDLIAASANATWRRERGIEMSSVTRSRLRRVAKEYVRPGVHVEDLHAALMQVKAQREAWRVLATDHRYPSVPTGLEAVLNTYRQVLARLQELERLLPVATEETALTKLALPALDRRLEELAGTEADLETLPERTILLRELREQGLGDLLDDFETRHVARHMIDAEVEQAWWQSVLEAMVSGDDFLAIQDGSTLSQIQREYGRADAKHVGSGAERVRAALARHWSGAIVDHRVGARDLRALLKIGDPEIAQLSAISPDLTGALVPVWVGAPLYLPTALPTTARFDATIILDAESLSLVGGLSAIARSPQVLAIGDPQAGAPRPLNVSVDPGEASHRTATPLSTFDALASVTPRRSLNRVHRLSDERLVAALSTRYDGGLSAVPLGGEGQNARVILVEGAMTTGGQAGSLTSKAEVEAVVTQVFASLEQHPERSLAVVAGNAEHARAVAKAIGKALPSHPEAQAVIQRRDEPFVVTSAERVSGLRRDALIFTVGYARTAHGRPVHDLGWLGTAAGARAVTATLGIGREDVTVVSAFGAHELDATRLDHGAALVHAVLDSLSHDGGAAAAVSRDLDTQVTPSDTLLRDLAERLRAWGLDVGVGQGYGIDLAVAPPAGSTAKPVAVVCDGSDDYAQAAVRERSRVRPTELHLRGWNPVQVWTIDVFSDPASVARRIASKAGVLTPRGRHDATAVDTAAVSEENSES
ncbi:MAG: DNA helicase [Galactobacter sp.]